MLRSFLLATLPCLAAAPLQEGAAPRGGASALPGALDEVAPLEGKDGKLALSVDECVRAVLRRNLGLRLAAVGTLENRAGIEQALGAFDPELYANATGTNAESPTVSSFQAPKNQSLDGAAGLRGIYRSGLAYDLGYTMHYNRQSPSNPFFGANPTISSGLAVNLSQPLLRGFGATVNEAPIEQARLLVARGDLDLYAQLQETAYSAVQAYWELVRARRERNTAQTAYDVAEELVRNNQKRLDAGTMTRIDVLTAQAEAARRKETLIRAENGVSRAEDAVKQLLSPGANLRDWRLAIEPTTDAALRDEVMADDEAAVLAAFDARSDLRALEVDLRAAELDVEVAHDGEKAKLDLTAGYSYGGLAGNSAGSGSKRNVRLWGDSLEAIRDRDFPTWSLGFDFSRPIGNRAAEAATHRAELEKERSYMTWLQKRMQIVQEVRGALRDVADARASAAAATQSRVLANEQYQAELVRLENQHSTTFQVREAQRDLFEAQDRETAALTQYEVLRASVEKARGALAEHYGVQWQPELRTEGALRD